jgi:hypothetical protein
MIKEGAVEIWEAATGKEVASVAAAPAAHLALTAGGRCLVTTDKDFLRVWDLATGKERRRWPLPSSAVDDAWGTSIVSNLLTLPDGRRAVTTLFDGTALVWDLSDALDSLEPLAMNPSENDMAAWWADLAGDDARPAYAAVWRLAEARRSAVGYLSKHLRAIPPPDAKIRQLIGDLDSESFAVREKAMKALEALGDAPIPALREALQKDPSPEVRRRVEKLLEDRPRHRLAPEAARSLRALHVLELIGSEDARRVLAQIAGGAAYATETREAKGALERLAKQRADVP